MPQHGHRKPFSAKQKKKQLQLKREKKRGRNDETGSAGVKSRDRSASSDRSSGTFSGENIVVKRLNDQPASSSNKRYDPNRYKLHFQSEKKEDLQKKKEEARVPLVACTEQMLEIDIEDIYKPGTVLDMPKRPSWDYKMSAEKVLAREEKYFREYLENVLEKHGCDDLSYMELNLETWRQLWRVLEMSDIVLLITDIRHPVLHFSPALYNYVIKELEKPLILVLNKIDLAPPALVTAWKHFFTEKYPNVHIVMFTSFPKITAGNDDSVDPGKVVHKRRKRRHFIPVGPHELSEACESIVQGKVNLNSWKEKIDDDVSNLEASSQPVYEYHAEDHDSSFSYHEQYKDGILTLGCCGYPNVGKSSLLNALVGKKVVSVSRTPGHTKHFQTIFLTKTVKLCDSPGLVFPSLIPKSMQILAGVYPIAQVREPYSAIAYLGQRLNLPMLLRLQHPEYNTQQQDLGESEWSAMDICEAWATKRGFLTAKAGRPDVYRAANNLLRMALDGRLCLCMRPPNFTAQRADWQLHPETLEISKIQQLHTAQDKDSDEEVESGTESEEEGSQEENECESSDDSAARRVTFNPFALLVDEDD